MNYLSLSDHYQFFSAYVPRLMRGIQEISLKNIKQKFTNATGRDTTQQARYVGHLIIVFALSMKSLILLGFLKK